MPAGIHWFYALKVSLLMSLKALFLMNACRNSLVLCPVDHSLEGTTRNDTGNCAYNAPMARLYVRLMCAYKPARSPFVMSLRMPSLANSRECFKESIVLLPLSAGNLKATFSEYLRIPLLLHLSEGSLKATFSECFKESIVFACI